MKPELNPTDFMSDFEMASMKAAKKYFPLAEIHGCLFHFTQNIWAHVQQLGLQSKYANDEDFAFEIKLLIALAYVPIDHVIEAFEELMQTEFYTDDDDKEYNREIQDIVAYFESTYIGAFNRLGQRKKPLYPIDVWNVYNAALMGSICFYYNICFNVIISTMLIIFTI